ncbi:hypothetical protein FRACA_1660012 [Frankia canadensis]|uniref:Uncharacterized protein n=1 Tax=Frankia canadensis TaxID=1836972 RepID=A0A2I2KMV6_9ACTN|nr:hypothetical protein FRACA_1660012 [Frankia canadensis]SOU54288.1 hypothetical protein FRACA_1660012 [Frankia canadensis]
MTPGVPGARVAWLLAQALGSAEHPRAA